MEGFHPVRYPYVGELRLKEDLRRSLSFLKNNSLDELVDESFETTYGLLSSLFPKRFNFS